MWSVSIGALFIIFELFKNVRKDCGYDALCVN